MIDEQLEAQLEAIEARLPADISLRIRDDLGERWLDVVVRQETGRLRVPISDVGYVGGMGAEVTAEFIVERVAAELGEAS